MTHAEFLERVERCFDPGELETLVHWEPGSGSGLMVSPRAAAIKVIHRPSGLEAESEQYPSQVRNKAAALLQLLQKLHDASSADDGR